MNNRTGNDTGSGSVNSQYRTYSKSISKGTQIISNILVAGATITLPIPGSEFYFPALSGLIFAATIGSYGKDTVNPYYAGTGLKVDNDNAFSAIELSNPGANDVFFQIVAGFDNYIDNRLTFPSIQYKQVSHSTYSTYRAALTSVTVTDLSGSVITDDNGNQFFAINRQQLTMFNNDSADYWFLTNTADTKDEASVHPLTSVQLPVSGNFKVKQGVSGASVNGIVSEIYNCLPKL